MLDLVLLVVMLVPTILESRAGMGSEPKVWVIGTDDSISSRNGGQWVQYHGGGKSRDVTVDCCEAVDCAEVVPGDNLRGALHQEQKGVDRLPTPLF